MITLVITTGAIGIIGSYVLGLWLYGNYAKQKQLEELALRFAEDQQKFNLYFYNIAIKVMKQKAAQQEKENVLQD